MDQQDLEEVLGNVIENATKWTKNEVRIEASEISGLVTIAIEDEGPGIPTERRQEALRTGVRLDTALPGSGLGLAIASDLVEIYGGEISLEDSPMLGGLKVVISLHQNRPSK